MDYYLFGLLLLLMLCRASRRVRGLFFFILLLRNYCLVVYTLHGVEVKLNSLGSELSGIRIGYGTEKIGEKRCAG